MMDNIQLKSQTSIEFYPKSKIPSCARDDSLRGGDFLRLISDRWKGGAI